ncbi:MAG TPA: hypothetical protein VKE71_04470 [Candidatus Angelobacter sp.]|nr:hypothetical protein [Candidatus Angelobacter sp.]
MTKFLCKTVLLFVLFAGFTPYSTACSRPPGYGFIVLATLLDESKPLPMYQNIGGQGLGGTFQHCLSGCQGDQSQWTGTTASDGTLSELNKSTPAQWGVSFSTPEQVFQCTGVFVLVDFQPSTSPQRAICTINQTRDAISSSPSSFDTSTGTYQYTVTMTDTSEAWPRTPYSFTNYDANGTVIASGTVTVTDSWDCWGTFWANSTMSVTQYLWLADSSGIGIGYATISVTNGTGGGG